MLTLLLVILYRRYKNTLKNLLFFKLFAGVTFFITCASFSQNVSPALERRQYDVIHKGKVKGEVTAWREINDEQTMIRIESEVTLTLLMAFTMKTREQAVFRKGNLTYASTHRHLNGKEKLNHQLHFTGSTYRRTGSDKEISPSYPIKHTSYSLYYEEPVELSFLYSDAIGRYVPVRKLADGKYRVDFPDGSYNTYWYERGICTLVEVNHQFFRIYFKLKKSQL